MNDLTLNEQSTGSLISSSPPPRHTTMHMHPPRAFNIQYSKIYDLKLTSQTLYHATETHDNAHAPTTRIQHSILQYLRSQTYVSNSTSLIMQRHPPRLFVGCLTFQQHASVSQERICSDNFTFCHTETEVADPTFYLTQSQYTDTGPTSPSDDPIMPGAWQGSHWSANFEVTGMTRPEKIPAQAGFLPGIFGSRGGRLNH